MNAETEMSWGTFWRPRVMAQLWHLSFVFIAQAVFFLEHGQKLTHKLTDAAGHSTRAMAAECMRKVQFLIYGIWLRHC